MCGYLACDRRLSEPVLACLRDRYVGRTLTAQHLLSGHRAVAQIAGDVGYESEAAFSRAFKRELGVPPATWRRNGGLSAASPA